MMSNIRMPVFHRLAATNLNHNYHHSMVISVLRALAAIEVAAAHLRAQFYPGLKEVANPGLFYQAFAFFTGFAHQAVVVFFLLSGWLVGGAFLNKYRDKHSVLLYGIDRVTRLWIVLIPAFILSLLLAALTGSVDPGKASFATTNEFSATAFAGNLFGLQDIWLPRYAGNFALWSLANETWYYILFPLLLTPWITKSVPARVAAAFAGAAFVWFLTWPILLFFALWLMGAAASRCRVEASAPMKIAMLVMLGSLSVYFRLTGNNDKLEPVSFGQDVLLSAVFLVLLCSLQSRADMTHPAWRIVKGWGAALAAFSFTLYVIHVPLIFAARDLFHLIDEARLSPDSLRDFATYVALLSTIIGFAYLFHLPFEAQTARARSRLKALLLTPEVQVKVDPGCGVTDAPRASDGSPASLFDTVIGPLSEQMIRSGKHPFALAPDISRLSYFVRRTRSAMKPEDFHGAACADIGELERCLATHWIRTGRPLLAAQAAHFGAAAHKARMLRASASTDGEVSPYVYVMF